MKKYKTRYEVWVGERMFGWYITEKGAVKAARMVYEKNDHEIPVEVFEVRKSEVNWQDQNLFNF